MFYLQLLTIMTLCAINIILFRVLNMQIFIHFCYLCCCKKNISFCILLALQFFLFRKKTGCITKNGLKKYLSGNAESIFVGDRLSWNKISGRLTMGNNSGELQYLIDRGCSYSFVSKPSNNYFNKLQTIAALMKEKEFLKKLANVFSEHKSPDPDDRHKAACITALANKMRVQHDSTERKYLIFICTFWLFLEIDWMQHA